MRRQYKTWRETSSAISEGQKHSWANDREARCAALREGQQRFKTDKAAVALRKKNLKVALEKMPERQKRAWHRKLSDSICESWADPEKRRLRLEKLRATLAAKREQKENNK